MRSTQDIFGDTVRGGYGAEDDDEWVTVPVNLIPGQMVTMITLKMARLMRIDEDYKNEEHDISEGYLQ